MILASSVDQLREKMTNQSCTNGFFPVLFYCALKFIQLQFNHISKISTVLAISNLTFAKIVRFRAISCDFERFRTKFMFAKFACETDSMSNSNSSTKKVSFCEKILSKSIYLRKVLMRRVTKEGLELRFRTISLSKRVLLLRSDTWH